MTSRLFQLVTMATMVSLVISSYLEVCDPENPVGCGFGGKCIKLSTSEDFFYGLLVGLNLDDFVCDCNINCYNQPRRLFCDTANNVTYYNEYCVKRAECKQQKAIEANCEGPCGDCEPLSHTGWRRCTIGVVNECLEDELCYEREDDIHDYVCKFVTS